MAFRRYGKLRDQIVELQRLLDLCELANARTSTDDLAASAEARRAYRELCRNGFEVAMALATATGALDELLGNRQTEAHWDAARSARFEWERRFNTSQVLVQQVEDSENGDAE